MSEAWIALVIGNTRLHWGLFYQEKLVGAWHTPHLTAKLADPIKQSRFRADAWQNLADIASGYPYLPQQSISLSDLWIASVVPSQTALWVETPDQGRPEQAHIVLRSHIPLLGLYATLGIDRAINLLGAGSTLGWPVLVIDSGTALTFTAGTGNSQQPTVYGGAILPGVRLQRQSLAQQTATLSGAAEAASSLTGMSLPDRWAADTTGAIASGLVYSLIATISDYLADWWQRFPTGQAVITGGDGPMLHALLQQRTPEVASRVRVDSYLMFSGMQVYRKALMRES